MYNDQLVYKVVSHLSGFLEFVYEQSFNMFNYGKM